MRTAFIYALISFVLITVIIITSVIGGLRPTQDWEYWVISISAIALGCMAAWAKMD